MANRTVRPRDVHSRIAAQKARRAATSIATVGSSSTSSWGLPAMARANRTRWVWPPESRSARDGAMSPTCASSRTSAVGSGCGDNPRIRSMSSRTVIPPMTPPVCIIAPTYPASQARRGGIPHIRTVPASGVVRPSNMSIVVDLPAPFGPSRATTSPGVTTRSTPSTASVAPQLFRNPTAEIPTGCAVVVIPVTVPAVPRTAAGPRCHHLTVTHVIRRRGSRCRAAGRRCRRRSG